LPERYLGQTLGKFRIDAVVGSGGFAWVYKAYDPELEIPVALKILKPQYAGDEKFEQRFRREASTAAKLRHPNIVKIFAVGKERDAVYFAMDYLNQGLADRLEVMTTLPESMLIRMGIDVASAIGFAHREGVIHRDIKVDNILFDEHGNAIVADFGIARAVSNYAEQTGTNMVVGTPQYFSPEQARGQTLDGRADIYSLGVTLFKAATGSLPFTGEDWYEIARQHVEDKPPKPRSINPSLSKELEEIILACLEKDPEDRFTNGEQLAQALANLLQERGEAVAVRTIAVPPMDTARSPVAAFPGVRRRLRKLGRAGAFGAGALVLFLSSALLYRGRRTEAADREHLPATTTTRRPINSNSGETVRPAVREPRVLALNAPKNADVTVNGVAIGSGPQRLDTLPPGRYDVIASVKAAPGCPTARDRKMAVLGEDGTEEVPLTPRPCGLLSISGKPTPSTYVITTIGGDRVFRGTLPLQTPLLLPVGSYSVRVSARFCADYHLDEMKIFSDKPNPTLRFTQICK
jgi:serine/threonine-protein kinase